jgi:hypothetical protein
MSQLAAARHGLCCTHHETRVTCPASYATRGVARCTPYAALLMVPAIPHTSRSMLFTSCGPAPCRRGSRRWVNEPGAPCNPPAGKLAVNVPRPRHLRLHKRARPALHRYYYVTAAPSSPLHQKVPEPNGNRAVACWPSHK